MPHGLKIIKFNDNICIVDSLDNKISFDEWINENSLENVIIIQNIYSVTNHCYQVESIFFELENLFSKIFSITHTEMYSYPTYPRFIIDDDKYKKIYKHLSEEQLIRFINYQDINKIYDSINITMARAIESYKTLLISIEDSLKERKKLLQTYKKEEFNIVDKNILDAVSFCIINLCSTLDLMGKMKVYINLLNKYGTSKIIKMKLIKSNSSYKNLIEIPSLKVDIKDKDLNALVDIRNDIIHNSSTIDIEKHMYIEVMNIKNSQQFIIFNLFFRDYDEYGRKIEFYGDVYQVEQKNNFEIFLSNCIDKVANVTEKFQEYILSETSYKALKSKTV